MLDRSLYGISRITLLIPSSTTGNNILAAAEISHAGFTPHSFIDQPFGSEALVGIRKYTPSSA